MLLPLNYLTFNHKSNITLNIIIRRTLSMARKKKNVRRCNLCWSHENRGDLQSAAAAASPTSDADDIVVRSLYHSIPSVLTRRAGRAYTRAPTSTHVADAVDVRTRTTTRPRRAHVLDAPFACSKDIQNRSSRVGRIERKRR